MPDPLFNDQFLLGVVVNKDRENNEKLMGGLMASQFRPNSMVGVVLQKNQSDRITELEGQVKSITADRDRLKAAPAATAPPPPPPGLSPPPPPPTGLSTGTSTPGGGTQGAATPQPPIDVALATLLVALTNERNELLSAIENNGGSAFDLARRMVVVPALASYSTPAVHAKYEAAYQQAIGALLDALKVQFIKAFSRNYSSAPVPAPAPAPAPPVPSG